ncbi:MAG TPA: DUF2063 domain-containing protein [Deltaproteobacteria bacterium]|nr:DUF2063 domain-containing protein [Deltaproteobacteria bacterium]
MGQRSGELPPDWREQMVEMIRGAAPVRGDWFAGGPVCSPEEQIGIYVQQYRLRLYDALLDEVPGLAALLQGDDEEAGERLLRRYLADHPPSSWTLNRIADALPGWLAEQPGVGAHLVEMALLDRAVQEGFDAAEGRPIQPAELATMPRLQLQPHVRLLRLRHNVHSLRSAALSRRPLPGLQAADFPLVVFRRGRKMRHWVVPLPAWGILQGIAAGRGVPEAIEDVFARGLVDAEHLTDEIGTWFRDFSERSLVQLAAPPGEP